MDCRTIKSHIENYLKNGAAKVLNADAERHLQSCPKCREKYTPLLGDTDAVKKIIPERTAIKGLGPLDDDPSDQNPDIFNPVEFKDAPVTFTLFLDGREEEIKMVEPQVDCPLPEGGRLVVRQKEACLTDVVFKFNPENDRPYELHFAAKAGVSYAKPHILTYGNPEINKKGFNDVYTEGIVKAGGIRARMEMTRGKARIYLRYTS